MPYFAGRTGWPDTYEKNYEMRIGSLLLSWNGRITQNSFWAWARQLKKHETDPDRMAEARPEEMISSQILRSRPGVCYWLRFWISEQVFICPSINLEQPVMVLVLFFLTYQLSCGMHHLILSVAMSLLVLKGNPGPHFVQRLFFLMNISLNIMYLVGICMCYVF